MATSLSNKCSYLFSFAKLLLDSSFQTFLKVIELHLWKKLPRSLTQKVEKREDVWGREVWGREVPKPPVWSPGLPGTQFDNLHDFSSNRKGNMIITNALNVYCLMLCASLSTHSDVHLNLGGGHVRKWSQTGTFQLLSELQCTPQTA